MNILVLSSTCSKIFRWNSHFHPVVRIFVEHWGNNLQIYPNFALFSTLGGWTSTTIFSGEQIKFHVSKFGWRPKKKKVFTVNGTLFFPQIRRRTKKKVFTKNGTLFSSNSNEDLRLDAQRNQIIGGDADEDHT